MKVYQQLNAARQEFHTLKLQKTGENKFAKYKYFELGDFLIPALNVLQKHGLCAFISFGEALATMRIVAVEDGSSIELTSPMAPAELKGCHPIQNLGAVETYTRRYLWVSALEIVEHDAIDSSKPLDEAAPKRKPANYDQRAQIPSVTGIEQYWEPGRIDVVNAVAAAVLQHYEAGDFTGAYEEYMGITDGEEKTYLRSRFAPEIKRMLKEQHDLATA